MFGHTALAETFLSHNSNVHICYTIQTTLHVNVYLPADFAEGSWHVDRQLLARFFWLVQRHKLLRAKSGQIPSLTRVRQQRFDRFNDRRWTSVTRVESDCLLTTFLHTSQFPSLLVHESTHQICFCQNDHGVLSAAFVVTRRSGHTRPPRPIVAPYWKNTVLCRFRQNLSIETNKNQLLKRSALDLKCQRF